MKKGFIKKSIDLPEYIIEVIQARADAQDRSFAAQVRQDLNAAYAALISAENGHHHQNQINPDGTIS